VRPLNLSYQIVEEFEKNPFQTIKLGSCHDRPEDVVVINEIYWDDRFTHELASLLKTGLHNLEECEETPMAFRMISRYSRGYSLRKYLETFHPPSKKRLNLCYELLKGLTAYDPYPQWIQEVLIAEDQIVLWDNELFFNELLVLSDPVKDPRVENFSSIAIRLRDLMQLILGDDPDTQKTIVQLVNRLSQNSEYTSIQSVFDDFSKIFLYDLFLDTDADASSTEPIPIPVPIPAPKTSDEAGPVSLTKDITPTLVTAIEPTSESIIEQPLPPVIEPASAEMPSAPVPNLLDELDADMEQNLNLFLKRNEADDEIARLEDIEDRSTKKRIFLWILALLGLALLVFGIWFALIPHSEIKASFTKTQHDDIWYLDDTSKIPTGVHVKQFQWTVTFQGKTIGVYNSQDLTLPLDKEGAYEILLRLQDTNNHWSKPFKDTLIQRFHKADAVDTDSSVDNGVSDEPLSRFTFQYDSNRISTDSKTFRSGKYALKILPGSNSAILKVRDFYLDSQGVVSFWILGSPNQEVKFTFRGLNQNKEVFNRTLTEKTTGNGQWDMIQFPVKINGLLESLMISVRSNGTVWFDDLSIDSYK